MKRLGIGAASLLVLLAGASPTNGQVGDQSSFSGSAAARLVAIDVDLDPTIAFDPLVDAGQAVAQARLDSLGASQSFASSLYPGNAVIALPGLLGTLTAGQLGNEVLPAYPLYVDASFPTKPYAEQRIGLYRLEAESRLTDSRAFATDGAATATARVDYDEASGDLVVRAESSIGALRVSDDLELVGLRSVAEVRRSPSGEIERSSSFDIAAISVLGQRISLGLDGLAVLGQEVPLGPLLQPLLPAVLDALAESGTTIEVVPEQELEDGVQTAALRISRELESPEALASGIESIRAVITVGGNIVSVSNEAIPALPTGGGDVTGGLDASFAPDVPSVGGSGLEIAAPTSGPADPAGPQSATTLLASVDSDISIADFYPVLMVAGIALFATARLFALLGGGSS